MRKKVFSAFIALMTALAAAAVSGASAVMPLGLEAGLSNSYVVSIAQDKRGLIWVATEDGLNIFAGSRFISIYKDEVDPAKGLSGNELNTLLDDPVDSVMWIGTQRAGINAFDYATGTVRQIRHRPDDPESLITDDVTRIVPYADGRLLVTTFWRGIDLFDTRTGVFEHFNETNVEGMPQVNIWTAAATPDGGTIYIGHKNGFMEMNPRTRTARNFTPDASDPGAIPGGMVYCIKVIKSGKVLLGTDNGPALYDPETRRFSRMAGGPLGGVMIYDIVDMGDSRYWIATEFHGVYILDLSKGFTPQALSRAPQLEQNPAQYRFATFRAIHRDTFGNIWLGDWGSGLVFVGLQPPLFALFDSNGDGGSGTSLSHRTVSNVAVDKEGRIWVGTDGGGLNVFRDGRREELISTLGGNPRTRHIQSSLCDSNGNLWFGMFIGGVWLRDLRSGKFAEVPLDSVRNEDVRSIVQKNDTIYIVGTGGVHKLDMNTRRNLGYLNVSTARDLAVDSLGRLWVGTFGGGLLVFDNRNELMRVFNVANGFPSNTVNDLFTDSSGTLWVATAEGLVHFEAPGDTVYRNYRHSDGMASSNVNAVAQDRHGNIWASTNKGISILSPDGIVGYGPLDNTPIGSFMCRSTATDTLGRIYFGALNGLCRFDPDEVLAVHEPPKAIITKFEVFGPGETVRDYATFGELKSGCPIKLDSESNTLSITANVTDYSLVNRVEYRFRLKGFDEDWFSNGSNQVTYRNLPSGTYIFQVDTRMRNQAWGGNISTVKITIRPPLYLTWWAKTIYFVLAALIIYLMIFFYRKRLLAESLYQLEKKQRLQDKELTDERLRFYTNVTHELRTPLTLIVGPLQDTLRSDKLPESERHRLSVINRNAERLLSLVNQILDFRKSETANKRLVIMKGNIVSTVYETALKYKELINGSRIKINISAQPESIIMPYDKESVGMILDNLISNALKYTTKGSIDIRCREAEDDGRPYVDISVQDTGYGISAEALPHIFDRYYQEKGSHQASGTGIGLALVKNLVELHHGTIKVESKVNEGSTFTLRLPLDDAYPEAIHPDDSFAPAPALPQNEENAAESGADDQRMPVVLVVEDNDDLREYIKESFTDLFEVREAANGQEGLEKAKTCLPDIVITDVMMPVMDGLEMTRLLKNDILTSHIPVIVLTAKDSDPDREEGYQAGADSYLTKPFSSQLLISRVNNILRARRRLAAEAAPLSGRKGRQEAAPEPDDQQPVKGPEITPLDKDFLERLHTAVAEHISTENVDVAFLSDTMYMSRATLYRKVKALTGLSPNEYIRKVRMQMAEQLLATGKYTVSEVSFKVGINSTPYFRQCFKEEFGVNPSDYLKGSS